MKKSIALLLAFILALSLTACSGSVSNGPEDPVSAEKESQKSTYVPQDDQDSNVLIAYFSWADNAALDEDVDAVTSPSVIAPGNVQQLAGWIQEKTGGDLFSIRVTDPYSSDWDECLDRANQERGDEARPELIENVENLQGYDVVFLGYPTWWYGVPMALLSFLENNDLSGKQVYLFCSHGTGGLASSVEIITGALPDGQISDNIFDCYEEDAANSEEKVSEWLNGLGY